MTFLGVQSSALTDLQPHAIALVGVPNATPYEIGKPSHSQGGPAAIRAASEKFGSWLDHYDFDTGSEPCGLGKARNTGFKSRCYGRAILQPSISYSAQF